MQTKCFSNFKFNFSLDQSKTSYTAPLPPSVVSLKVFPNYSEQEEKSWETFYLLCFNSFTWTAVARELGLAEGSQILLGGLNLPWVGLSLRAFLRNYSQ